MKLIVAEQRCVFPVLCPDLYHFDGDGLGRFAPFDCPVQAAMADLLAVVQENRINVFTIYLSNSNE